MNSEVIQALALAATAMTPVMLAVIAMYAAQAARRSEAKAENDRSASRRARVLAAEKMEVIHKLVNSNLTIAKNAELTALRAWALSLESHPEHDPRALETLRERIAVLEQEIETRDEVAEAAE